VQDNQLEAQPGSRLPVVVDSHGREVERNALVQREQTVGGPEPVPCRALPCQLCMPALMQLVVCQLPLPGASSAA
jgi:hypothetical protein